MVQFRIMDGTLRKGDLVKFMNTGCEYDITELGVLSPKPIEVSLRFLSFVKGGGAGGGALRVRHHRAGGAVTPGS